VTKALRLTQSEWVAVINDDCVLEPDALAELLAAGRSDESVGAVAGTVRFSARPDLINSAGIEVDELGVAWERNLGYADTDEAVTEIFGASGVLALYRRTMLDEVGGFDESFFAYLEDADLAWRARMAGWRCLYAPGARALHRHSAVLGHGSPSKHYLVGRNRVRMLAKNATTAQLCRRAAQIVIYDAAYILAVALRGRSLAPLRGRVRGLREWRTYREEGKARRNTVKLSASPGLRGALARDRAYRLVGAAGLHESKRETLPQ
jgi:GT2 family glycosyltransferase